MYQFCIRHSKISVLSLFMEWYYLLLAYILHTNISQRLSIGFRSSEHAGHFNLWMWLAENHSEVVELVWMTALFSWKVYFLRRNQYKQYGNKGVSNTLTKSLLFILDEVKESGRVPWLQKEPHTITLPLPKFSSGEITFYLL